MASLDTTQSAESVEVADALFCPSHLKEVCADCKCDQREENDQFFGFEPTTRDGINCPPAHINKDGAYACKKHGSTTCTQCFSWKKQIVKLRAQAKKTAAANKKPESNLHV